MHAATPSILVRPLLDHYLVEAKGEIIVVRQHVHLEPLGI